MPNETTPAADVCRFCGEPYDEDLFCSELCAGVNEADDRADLQRDHEDGGR